jgi:hypothetical protein
MTEESFYEKYYYAVKIIVIVALTAFLQYMSTTLNVSLFISDLLLIIFTLFGVVCILISMRIEHENRR